MTAPVPRETAGAHPLLGAAGEEAAGDLEAKSFFHARGRPLLCVCPSLHPSPRLRLATPPDGFGPDAGGEQLRPAWFPERFLQLARAVSVAVYHWTLQIVGQYPE